jgi:hypothetical protein
MLTRPSRDFVQPNWSEELLLRQFERYANKIDSRGGSCSFIPQVISPMKTQSPVTIKTLAKHARMDDMDGEVEDSVLFKRQKLGRIEDNAEKENIDPWSVQDL